MNIIKRLWLAAKGEDSFPQSDHIIEYAFTSGGVKYYQYQDIFNIPYKRGLEIVEAYEELGMKCDREYLLEHAKLVEEILHGNRITMNEWNRLNRINSQLLQRLEWVVVPDLAYKLAAVVFFDKSENPEDYDLKYGLKKIERWKKNDDVQSFFLRQPVVRLMPFLNALGSSFPTYFRAVESLNQHHSNNLSTKFSESEESEHSGKE